KPAEVAVIGRVDPTASLAITSEEVSFKVGDRSVPGTLVRPATGVWAGLVMIAGSGPTDRDWKSPMIAGANGSGKLVPQALAAKGVVVLRYDKAAIGGNTMPGDQVVFETYLDEARAALAYLRTRAEVDGSHLVVVGHSEGGLHAIRVAIAEGGRIA